MFPNQGNLGRDGKGQRASFFFSPSSRFFLIPVVKSELPCALRLIAVASSLHFRGFRLSRFYCPQVNAGASPALVLGVFPTVMLITWTDTHLLN